MKSKLLDIEVDEKIFKIICFIGILLIILFCLALYLELGTPGSYRIPLNINFSENNEIEFKIDRINVSRKYIEISGWSYKRGQNIGYFGSRFIIQHQGNMKYKVLNTEMTEIAELFSVDGQFDCRRAGMYAKSIAVGMKKGPYKIFIEYKNDGENYLVDTGETFNY